MSDRYDAFPSLRFELGVAAARPVEDEKTEGNRNLQEQEEARVLRKGAAGLHQQEEAEEREPVRPPPVASACRHAPNVGQRGESVPRWRHSHQSRDMKMRRMYQNISATEAKSWSAAAT